jgi:AbrB family looped-hinge helix DNA binding protein
MAFTRKMDDLGRISIPKEVRNAMGWNSQDEIEMTFTSDNKIILSKHFPNYTDYLIHLRNLMIDNDDLSNKDEAIAAINAAIEKIK